MAKTSFDHARRQLDEALQRLETAASEASAAPASAPPEAGPGVEAPAQPDAAPGVSAAPSPRPRSARRRALAYRAAGRSAGTAAVAQPTMINPNPTIRLDDTEAPTQGAPVTPAAPAAHVEPDEHAQAATLPPPPSTKALLRLVVGGALLGLEGLAARSGAWEAAAGISRPGGATPAGDDEAGPGRFRYALIGWLFEAETHLRPRGNPIAWLRTVVAYLFGTVFSVVIEMLPLPRFGARRRRANADPTDEDTQRWIARGLAEAEPSRRFARAALEDMLHHAIIYAADRPAVAQALGAIVRSPAMDEAVEHIVAGPVIEQAIGRVAASPALDTVVARVAASPALDTVVARVAASPALDTVIDSVARSPALDAAIGKIVRSPAMEEAVAYLTETPAMDQAIETLSQNPALAELVRSQSSSLAHDILNDVRGLAIQGDHGLENLVRRALRRPPRASLPRELRGLLITGTTRDPDR